jgi:hypothetical protein
VPVDISIGFVGTADLDAFIYYLKRDQINNVFIFAIKK